MVKDWNQLREQWRSAKHARNNEKSLTQKREELDRLIDQTTQDLDNKKLNAHRIESYSPDQAKILKDEIARKQSLLKEMTDKKREVDALLDTYESLIDVEMLKRELAMAIEHAHPERAGIYGLLETQIQDKRQLELKAAESARLLSQIQRLLTEALEQRQEMRRRGLISYLFGTNHYYVITQRLHAMGLLIQNHLQYFERNEVVTDFLSRLKIDAEKRWGYKHLDTFLPAAQMRLAELIAKYQGDEQQAGKEKAELEKKLDDWFEG